ncbi:hypothetical protein ACFV1L_26625 [Kitasatospora sp. NPDC059646]|uniref:hypothetical protein n=1 Tax=Kitasatospora sp. NPDC059646 TaxID=3346893 RepID=UPI0036C36138
MVVGTPLTVSVPALATLPEAISARTEATGSAFCNWFLRLLPAAPATLATSS